MSEDTKKSCSSPEVTQEVPTIPGCLSQAERLLQAVNNYTGIALALAMEENKPCVAPGEIREIYSDMQDIAGRLGQMILKINFQTRTKENPKP